MNNTLGQGIDRRVSGIPLSVPCLDRYCPVAISILFQVHRNIANHKGADRTWLQAMPLVFIFQGQSLCADIVKCCFSCRPKLKAKVQDQFLFHLVQFIDT